MRRRIWGWEATWRMGTGAGSAAPSPGRSNRVAIYNAIRNAAALVDRNLIGTIEASLSGTLAIADAAEVN